MVTYNGQHCVVVSIVNAYTVEIHTRKNGAKRVYFTALRETERGEIQKQMKMARDGVADNSELWTTADKVS
jgi:hypothetical protein